MAIFLLVAWWLLAKLAGTATWLGWAIRLFTTSDTAGIDADKEATNIAHAGLQDADLVMLDAKSLAANWNTYKGVPWYVSTPYFVLWDFDILNVLKKYTDHSHYALLCKFYRENATDGHDLQIDITKYATSGTKGVAKDMGLI
jgi:hypothetical protein